MADFEDAFIHYALMDFERVVATIGIGEVFALLSDETKQDIVNHILGEVTNER